MAFVNRLPAGIMTASGPSQISSLRSRTFCSTARRAIAAPSEKVETNPNPTIGSLMNRKSFGDAWRGLTPNQRLGFGAFVLVAGMGEYWLLKKYILDPVRAKKEAEARTKIEVQGEVLALPGDTA